MKWVQIITRHFVTASFRRIELVAACCYPDSSREMASFACDRGRPRTLSTEQNGYKTVEGAQCSAKDVNRTLNDDQGRADSVEGLTENMDKLLESKDITGRASQMAKTLQSKDFDLRKTVQSVPVRYG